MKECFLKYLKGKTIVLITHALYYVKHADYVFVMNDGTISLQGDYNSLQKIPLFNSLVSKIKHNHSDDENQSPALFLKEEKQINSHKLKQNINSDDNIDSDNDKQILQNPNEISKYIPIPTKDSNGINEKNIVIIDDKLILDEDRKKGAVSFDLYLQYFKMLGGIWCFLALLFGKKYLIILYLLSH